LTTPTPAAGAPTANNPTGHRERNGDRSALEAEHHRATLHGVADQIRVADDVLGSRLSGVGRVVADRAPDVKPRAVYQDQGDARRLSRGRIRQRFENPGEGSGAVDGSDRIEQSL